jgi:hypothetical protein
MIPPIAYPLPTSSHGRTHIQELAATGSRLMIFLVGASGWGALLWDRETGGLARKLRPRSRFSHTTCPGVRPFQRDCRSVGPAGPSGRLSRRISNRDGIRQCSRVSRVQYAPSTRPSRELAMVQAPVELPRTERRRTCRPRWTIGDGGQRWASCC